jgi:hypothetical protein
MIYIDMHTSISTLPVRPVIPRRSSPRRMLASHHLLSTSQMHTYQEQKQAAYPPMMNNIEHESNNNNENNIDAIDHLQSLKKSVRFVHSSSMRRQIDRLFSRENDVTLSSTRTLVHEPNDDKTMPSSFTRDSQSEANLMAK